MPGRGLAEAAARAAYIGGCAGTTHAMAARTHNIPVVGLISDTMLAAYEDVALAYDALSSHFPDGCHLNLPTEAPLMPSIGLSVFRSTSEPCASTTLSWPPSVVKSEDAWTPRG